MEKIYSKFFYNAEQKERFINSEIDGKDVKETFEAIFDSTYYLESLLDKDLCCFNFTDFQVLFSFSKWSLGTVHIYKFYIQRYIEYCLNFDFGSNQSFLDIKNFDEFKDVDLTNFMTTFFFKDLDECLDFLEMVYSSMPIEQSCMQITAFGLILIGINRKDVLKIKREQIVNYEKNGGLIYKEEKIIIPERLLEYCEMACRVKCYPSKVTYTYFADNSYLLRGKRTKNSKDCPLNYSYFTLKNKYVKEQIDFYKGDNLNWCCKELIPTFLEINHMFIDWKNKYGKEITEEIYRKYEPNREKDGFLGREAEYKFWLKYYHGIV